MIKLIIARANFPDDPTKKSGSPRGSPVVLPDTAFQDPFRDRVSVSLPCEEAQEPDHDDLHDKDGDPLVQPEQLGDCHDR